MLVTYLTTYMSCPSFERLCSCLSDSVTRCWNKVAQCFKKLPNSNHNSYYLKWDIFQSSPKSCQPNIWATFVRNFVTSKTFKKYPNLVTLNYQQCQIDFYRRLRYSVAWSVTRYWRKKLPNFSKSGPKRSHCNFILRSEFFKFAQKVTKHLGYFWRKFVAKIFQK